MLLGLPDRQDRPLDDYFIEQLAGRIDGSHRDPHATDRYLEYQDDPVRFGTEVLGSSFVPDVVRMMESVRDHVITVARSANAVGKTHGAAHVAIWWYKCFPGAQVYTTAAPPVNNLQLLLWGEIGSIMERRSNVFEGDRIYSSMHVKRSEKEFLTGVAIPQAGTPEQRQAKFSGKHAPYLLFIVDEGDAVPDEVYQGIESCMSGGHARLLIMLNPRAEQGAPYRYERDGRANVVELPAFRHTNITSGKTVIPGAVDIETTGRRINRWTRPLMTGEKLDPISCYQVPEVFVGYVAHDENGTPYAPIAAGWRKITDPQFSYMVLARYPAQSAHALINKSWIAAARLRWDQYVARHGEVAPWNQQLVMGLDVAEFGGDANVACYRAGGWVGRLETWDGMNTNDVAKEGIRRARVHKPTYVLVDAIGVGSAVPYRMREGFVAAHPVKVSEKPTERAEELEADFYQLRDQCYWKLREWLRDDPAAMLPPDDALEEELSVIKYSISPTRGIVVDNKDTLREQLGRSPDRMEALMLTHAPPPRVLPGGLRQGSVKGWGVGKT